MIHTYLVYKFSLCSEIDSVVYVKNRRLLQKFEGCKRRFLECGVPATETLLFHGTDCSNLDSIFSNNFMIDQNPKGRDKVDTIFLLNNSPYEIVNSRNFFS